MYHRKGSKLSVFSGDLFTAEESDLFFCWDPLLLGSPMGDPDAQWGSTGEKTDSCG